MMMNSCGLQQNSEMRRDTVVCPKPRRVGVLNNHHLARSLRWQVSRWIYANRIHEGNGYEQDPKMTSSPPLFFTGSPPTRVSNPLTKDLLFRDELLVVAPPPSTPRATKPPPPSSPRNGGGCVRVSTNFGNNPTVRVVGFNCLDRDRSSSVPTLA
ncbi:PREDICTED: uncharacterized protein LOC106310357 isoform X2 [Brassica oleracea var. oleracea]|uniref:uncharacterized protein LOC106310357 isoform X2 n=1 Tax=Brassica oleracea var. oleracea TaxID=109376 RepID=UPI0006A74371|nr:PREDICTED: uncharacterized protein LOC106310357 isoform X2 [Brassica oleracea var. oleracea]